MPPSLPSFGKRLRHLRLAAGLKQDALARQMGVDQTTVSRWESGRQVPVAETQQATLASLTPPRLDDSALKRLVETSRLPVHLVEDSTHICLAYSRPRARDWNATNHALLGTSLWRFATPEIRQAEAELDSEGWWDSAAPRPKLFRTSQAQHPEIRISKGPILWERIYLSDGTPARLVSGLHAHA